MTTDIFEAVAADAWARTHRQARWLNAAATAKLVRAALKEAFPGVKFSVRSETYSGGASINVKWIDGPRTRAVESVAHQFAGKRFDGMIDLGYGVSHYLTSDGRVMLAHDPGSHGSGGMNTGTDNRDLSLLIPDDAEMVHFGSDYVFCTREVTDYNAKAAAALEWLRANCHLEDEGRRFGNQWTDTIASAMARDYLPGEDWRETFERFTNRD